MEAGCPRWLGLSVGYIELQAGVADLPPRSVGQSRAHQDDSGRQANPDGNISVGADHFLRQGDLSLLVRLHGCKWAGACLLHLC